jgi:drug/metabolite transporter (DMT)-like permease
MRRKNGGIFILNGKNIFGHMIALLTILIWGTTYISTKIILRDLSPVEILFYRFMIGYGILWLAYPRFQRPSNVKDEWLFFGLGCTGITFYFLLENIALQYTQASNVGLLISAAPILTALIARTLKREEKINRDLVVGFCIAIIGVFLVVFNGKLVLKINPLGDLLALLAALIWAAYSVLLKSVDSRHEPILVVRRTFFYGLLTIFPCLLLFKADLRSVHAVSIPLVLNILFLGVAASALCFVLWNKAARIIGIVKTSNYIYLVPFITMVTSVIFLRETINALMVIGGVLIVFGVHISENGLSMSSYWPMIKFRKD